MERYLKDIVLAKVTVYIASLLGVVGLVKNDQTSHEKKYIL